jgi:hypothetical protein
MDDFLERLALVEQSLKDWSNNSDNHEAKIKELEGMSKGLSSLNSDSTFPWPKHSSNFGSCNGFTHKLKIGVPRFDREDDRETTRWITILEYYFELHQMYDNDLFILHHFT